MTDQAITEKDLDLIDTKDDAPAEGDKGADDSASKGGDAKDEGKESGKDAKGTGSVFDGLDDDDDDADAGDKGKKDKAEAETGDKGAKSADEAKDKGDDKAGAKKDDTDGDDDWRKKVVEKILAPVKDKLTQAKFEKRGEQIAKQLSRYKSVEDAIAAGVLAQERLRSGNKLDKDATEEEAAKWRKENDIPEAPDKYDIPAVPGHTWDATHDASLGSFKQIAHRNGINQSVVNELVKWHVQDTQRIAEEWDDKQKKQDQEDKDACLDTLRTEFGAREARQNMKLSMRLLEDEDVFGGKVASDAIMSARYIDPETGDWRRLINMPGFSRGLIGMALDRYGDGPLPAEDGRTATGKTRLEEINAIMRDDYDRYMREGLADEAMKIMREDQERAEKRGRRKG